MEVNDIALLDYPCAKYIEQPREELVRELTQTDKNLMLQSYLKSGCIANCKLQEENRARVLILSEPLCDLKTREQIFHDLVHIWNGKRAAWLL